MALTINVQGCASCPFEQDFNGGDQACAHPGGPLPGTIDVSKRIQVRMPWCPLDDEPALVQVISTH